MSIEALDLEIDQLKKEFEKFKKGNKSAGTRARKVLQNIKKICQDLRTEIQNEKQGPESEE
jgi:predicted RNase H-like nuclease (RuvC/YqgF family)